MNFTEEHILILEQHKHHWIGLRDVQVMKNLDRSVIDALQKIFNEAVGPQRFTPWCSDCVSDLVRMLYSQYEKWEELQLAEPIAEEGTGETGHQPPGGRRGRKSKNKGNGD